MVIKILQTNLGRRRAAHDLAYAYAKQQSIDIIIVSEPNKKLVNSDEWIKDRRGDVAVLFVNKGVEILGVMCGDGYVCLNLDKCDVYCCYISPNISFEHYKENVDHIMEAIRSNNKEAIVLGDINSKSPQWGSPTMDARGEYFTEWLSTLNLVVINTGEEPTFVRGDSKSYIDVTCSSVRIANEIDNWRVVDIENMSDHKYIYFEMKGVKRTKRKFTKKKVVMDQEVFRASLELRVQTEADSTYKTKIKIIRQAYNDSISRQGDGRRMVQPYWWNCQIKAQRETCTRHRRYMTRIARGTNVDNEEKLAARRTYKESKKELRKLIDESKRQHWKNLCDELNDDIWGDGYKIATRSLRGLIPYRLPLERRREIACLLFPRVTDSWDKIGEIADVDPFTLEELNTAAVKMKSGRAPGLDGIPPEAIKEVAKIVPEWLLDMMNSLLRIQKFPNEWKTARLVLILKGGKPPEKMTSYRPLCLLSTLGKLFEAMIKMRLEREIANSGGLHRNQFGFCKGKSTIQALERVTDTANQCGRQWCVLVTLDVTNAFNTACHSIIIEELRTREIPQYLIELISSYFMDRYIQIDKIEKIAVSAGVPQGSVLGPLLWNILYDGVLRLELTEYANTIGFADDLALLVSADDKNTLERNTNYCLRRINTWMLDNKLKLAPEKTEAIILKGKRKRDGICFTIGSTEIYPRKTVRYLGVTLDEWGSYGHHVKNVVNKAENRTAILSRMMPNIGGPVSGKREVLCGVIHSIILYGAPIWRKACEIKKYNSMLAGAQRKVLLRVASAYRTVSIAAIQVITGVIPIDLLVEERRYLYKHNDVDLQTAKIVARRNSVTRWQARWEDNNTKGQWTKRLIPNIAKWLDCTHRQLDYYLTQVLTGHGAFKTYTRRIGKEENDTCVYCGESDTVEHTVFQCNRWGGIRETVYAQLGHDLDPDVMIERMIQTQGNWTIIHNMIKTVMRNKEMEERRRLGAG